MCLQRWKHLFQVLNHHAFQKFKVNIKCCRPTAHCFFQFQQSFFHCLHWLTIHIRDSVTDIHKRRCMLNTHVFCLHSMIHSLYWMQAPVTELIWNFVVIWHTYNMTSIVLCHLVLSCYGFCGDWACIQYDIWFFVPPITKLLQIFIVKAYKLLYHIAYNFS